jgi:hypothetical protein
MTSAFDRDRPTLLACGELSLPMKGRVETTHD